jgi:hypothetical protein
MTQTDSKTPQGDQLLEGIPMKAIVYTQFGSPVRRHRTQKGQRRHRCGAQQQKLTN